MVITLTMTAIHDGDMHSNCHPGEGDDGCFLRAWSHVLCLCETLSLLGQCPPAPNGSDLAPGWHTAGNVSLLLGLGWGLSMHVLSMGRLVPWSADVVAVCRIFLSDSCHIRPPFHPSGGPGEEEEPFLQRPSWSGEGLVNSTESKGKDRNGRAL